MADVKRLNYFTYQFLVENDFKDEQAYHLDMRRKHNAKLHSWGVADGLDVTQTAGDEVTVGSGLAIDKDGNEIVLPESAPHSLAGVSADTYLVIEYGEEFDAADHYTSGGVDNYTRTTERPLLSHTASPPSDGSKIVLALISITAGNISAVDNSVRKEAGVAIAPGSVSTLELADGAVTLDKLAPSAQPSVSIDGVSNPGGDIDLIGGNAITITPDNANDRITISENHSVATGNPHGMTPADLGVLPTSGGTLTGDLQVNGNIGTTGTVDGRDVSEDGANLDAHTASTGNPHGTTAADVGALSLAEGGTVARTSKFIVSSPDSLALAVRYGVPDGSPAFTGGIGVWVNGGPTTYGIYIHHVDATKYALYVNSGQAYFAGGKGGFVVDRFINASGTTLRAGDIVRLTKNGSVGFHGNMNSIPINEVTLADKEDDPLVIGIVDSEALPLHDQPDTRQNPEDPYSISPGCEVMVVTLGAYARCKVDATEAPIEVGDLLTTSSNAGHARKAVNPKIGCVIGKALEPLKEGTGHIAVFANIQ